jgi:cardiolipin synthase
MQYVRYPKRMRRGNTARCLHDGSEGLSSMLKAIRSAQRSILMEFYIFRDDKTGHTFADALIERAKAGILVHVVIDAWGNLDVSDDFYDAMRAAGVQVHEYRPLTFLSAFRGPGRRNHRKICVIDHCQAFVGGLNIADDYASIEQGGHGWRDTLVELEGPIVHDVVRLMLNSLATFGSSYVDYTRPSASDLHDGAVWAGLLTNSAWGQRHRIRRSYLKAIEAAQESIFVANAYFLPGRKVRRALARAVRRGVSVRIMLPKHSDVRVVGWASRYLFGRLLRSGVELYEWTESMLHAKVAVVDQVWSTVGSYNLDQRSLRTNLEANIVMFSREVGERLHADLIRDTARCERVAAQVWSKRSLMERIRAWFFYQFRALM